MPRLGRCRVLVPLMGGWHRLERQTCLTSAGRETRATVVGSIRSEVYADVVLACASRPTHGEVVVTLRQRDECRGGQQLEPLLCARAKERLECAAQQDPVRAPTGRLTAQRP
jgi:hypothetical protein